MLGGEKGWNQENEKKNIPTANRCAQKSKKRWGGKTNQELCTQKGKQKGRKVANVVIDLPKDEKKIAWDVDTSPGGNRKSFYEGGIDIARLVPEDWKK